MNPVDPSQLPIQSATGVAEVDSFFANRKGKTPITSKEQLLSDPEWQERSRDFSNMFDTSKMPAGPMWEGDTPNYVPEDYRGSLTLEQVVNSTPEEFNERMAEMQSTGDRLANAVVNNVVTAGTQFASTLLNIPFTLLQGSYDNFITQSAAQIQESVQKENPIYRSKEYEEKSLMDKLSTDVFWADLIQSMGFTEGMMAAGLLTGGFGMGGMAGAVTTGIVSAMSEGATEAINMRNRIERQNVQMAESQLDRAAFENNGILSDDIYRSYTDDMLQMHDDLRRAENMVYAANVGILSLSNILGWGNMLTGSSWKSVQNAAQKTVQKELEGQIGSTAGKVFLSDAAEKTLEGLNKETVSAGIKTGLFGKNIDNLIKGGTLDIKNVNKALEYSKSFAKHAFMHSPIEAAEEGAQYIASEFPSYYADYNHFNDSKFNTNKKELAATAHDALLKTWAQAMEDGQFFEDIASGYLMGFLGVSIPGHGGGLVNAMMDTNKTIKEKERLNGIMNEYFKSNPDLFYSFLDDVTRQLSFNDELEKFSKEKDIKGVKDTEYAKKLSSILAFANAGRLDVLKNLIENTQNLTNEQITDLIKQTTNVDENGKKSGLFIKGDGNAMNVTEVRELLTERLDDFVQEVANVQKDIEDYKVKQLGLSDDAIDSLVYANGLIRELRKRNGQISKDNFEYIRNFVDNYQNKLIKIDDKTHAFKNGKLVEVSKDDIDGYDDNGNIIFKDGSDANIKNYFPNTPEEFEKKFGLDEITTNIYAITTEEKRKELGTDQEKHSDSERAIMDLYGNKVDIVALQETINQLVTNVEQANKNEEERPKKEEKQTQAEKEKQEDERIKNITKPSDFNRYIDENNNEELKTEKRQRIRSAANKGNNVAKEWANIQDLKFAAEKAVREYDNSNRQKKYVFKPEVAIAKLNTRTSLSDSVEQFLNYNESMSQEDMALAQILGELKAQQSKVTTGSAGTVSQEEFPTIEETPVEKIETLEQLNELQRNEDNKNAVENENDKTSLKDTKTQKNKYIPLTLDQYKKGTDTPYWIADLRDKGKTEEEINELQNRWDEEERIPDMEFKNGYYELYKYLDKRGGFEAVKRLKGGQKILFVRDYRASDNLIFTATLTSTKEIFYLEDFIKDGKIQIDKIKNEKLKEYLKDKDVEENLDELKDIVFTKDGFYTISDNSFVNSGDIQLQIINVLPTNTSIWEGMKELTDTLNDEFNKKDKEGVVISELKSAVDKKMAGYFVGNRETDSSNIKGLIDADGSINKNVTFAINANGKVVASRRGNFEPVGKNGHNYIYIKNFKGTQYVRYLLMKKLSEVGDDLKNEIENLCADLENAEGKEFDELYSKLQDYLNLSGYHINKLESGDIRIEQEVVNAAGKKERRIVSTISIEDSVEGIGVDLLGLNDNKTKKKVYKKQIIDIIREQNEGVSEDEINNIYNTLSADDPIVTIAESRYLSEHQEETNKTEFKLFGEILRYINPQINLSKYMMDEKNLLMLIRNNAFSMNNESIEELNPWVTIKPYNSITGGFESAVSPEKTNGSTIKLSVNGMEKEFVVNYDKDTKILTGNFPKERTDAILAAIETQNVKGEYIEGNTEMIIPKGELFLDRKAVELIDRKEAAKRRNKDKYYASIKQQKVRDIINKVNEFNEKGIIRPAQQPDSKKDYYTIDGKDYKRYHALIDQSEEGKRQQEERNKKYGNTGFALQQGYTRGTNIHNAFFDVLNGTTKTNKDYGMNEKAYEDIKAIAGNFKNAIKKMGHSYVGDSIVVWNEYVEKDGRPLDLAGEIDLMTIDRDGMMYIWDIKTQKQYKGFEKDHTEEYKESNVNQVSAYIDMAKKLYNENVSDEVRIIQLGYYMDENDKGDKDIEEEIGTIGRISNIGNGNIEGFKVNVFTSKENTLSKFGLDVKSSPVSNDVTELKLREKTYYKKGNNYYFDKDLKKKIAPGEELSKAKLLYYSTLGYTYSDEDKGNKVEYTIYDGDKKIDVLSLPKKTENKETTVEPKEEGNNEIPKGFQKFKSFYPEKFSNPTEINEKIEGEGFNEGIKGYYILNGKEYKGIIYPVYVSYNKGKATIAMLVTKNNNEIYFISRGGQAYNKADDGKTIKELYDISKGFINKTNLYDFITKREAYDKFVVKSQRFRVAKEDLPVWDKEKELQWLDTVLPNVSKEYKIDVVSGLIHIGDTTAYGAVRDGILQLSDMAAEGTTYHEAFHIVFNGILTDVEREELYNEGVRKYGVTDPIDIEERMAEDFREYVTQRKTIGELYNQSKKNHAIARFFDALYNKIKSIWHGFGTNLMDSYFRKINSGEYARESINSFKANDFKIKEEKPSKPDNFSNETWNNLSDDIQERIIQCKL